MMSKQLSLKQALFDHCHQQISGRIESLEAALASVEESRNNETKSSVGDKYETGRAMMQQEEEKYRAQLANAVLLKRTLEQIDPARPCEKVEAGSLVVTNAGTYFMAVGIGKIKQDGHLYYAISVEAPISRALLGKKKDAIINFNQKQLQILDIS
jgi:transcription elongation GreA/GreB family factor